MVDNCLKSFCAPPIARQHFTTKLLAEYPATAQDSVAPETPHKDCQSDTSPSNRQIRWPPYVTTLNPAASAAATRANPERLVGAQSKPDLLSVDLNFLDCETGRGKCCPLKSLKHAPISSRSARCSHQTAANVSQSQELTHVKLPSLSNSEGPRSDRHGIIERHQALGFSGSDTYP
jgi:hypothetical protein